MLRMLTFTLQDRVAVIDWDDGKANAITPALCEQMNGALDRAEKDAGAVVIVGRPGRFCAGFDLNEFKKGPDATRALLNLGGSLMLRLFRHPQPVVAACTGHAVAGGALILLTADTRIAADGEFKIGLNETAISMVLPTFGIELAQHRLSRNHVQAAVIQARMSAPAHARTVGFVDEVVAAEEVKARAVAAGTALAQLPVDAYAGNKIAIRADTIARLEASMPI